MNLGEKIRARREYLGMTQEELALTLGYKSRATINKIELGSRELKQSKIKEIADALKIKPSELMGWNEHENPEIYLDDDKRKLIENYEMLNDEGKEKVNEYVEDLIAGGRYKKISDAQNSQTEVG